jgi:nucleoid-associated protein YgaU
MSKRNANRIIRTNSTEIHKETLKNRGLKKVQQYTTPTGKDLTPQQRRKLKRIKHIWSPGDRLYKLAFEHYGDSELWWLIAWYNKKPTESHFKLGQVVLIPLPLDKALSFYYNQG